MSCNLYNGQTTGSPTLTIPFIDTIFLDHPYACQPVLQRSQRQRRKPKRWDDDEVEVDFSGTTMELASDPGPPAAKKVCTLPQPEVKEEPIASEEEEEEENEEAEEEEDEDDPNKLWCTCRQPHNGRFMIECDGCQEWFHGTCVSVTRAKAKQFEKKNKKWYCTACRKNTMKTPVTRSPRVNVKPEPTSPPIKSPVKPLAKSSRGSVKQEPTSPPPKPASPPPEPNKKAVTSPAPETPLSPIGSPQQIVPPTKLAEATSSVQEKSEPGTAETPNAVPSAPPSNVQTSLKKPIKPKSVEGKEILGKKVVKNENSMQIGQVLKQRKLKALGAKISPVDKKEGVRLKKLVKSSKIELKKKLTSTDKLKAKALLLDKEKGNLKSKKIKEKNKEKSKVKEKVKEKEKEKEKEREREKDGIQLESISKVVPLVRKQEDKKKKQRVAPVDRSLQDLFKAEPTMVLKKLGQSTPSTPTTPSALTAGLKRPSIGSEISKKRPSLSLDQNCVCCGKNVTKGAIKGKEASIYCTETCLEKHVKDSVDVIKQARAHSSNLNNGNSKGERLRINIVEKATNRLLSGSSAPTDDKVLEFIKSNPTFEVMKPNLVRRQSSQSSDHDKKKEGPKSSSVTTPKSSAAKKKDDGNAKPKPSEIPAKTESRRDDNSVETIRSNVKKVLKETLEQRCQEADNKMLSEDIQKIAFKIEEELFNHFKDTSNKYKTRYRSLVFNLKDTKNQGLFRKVLTGSITPEKLVRMSADELASSELAKWRERENKHALEMIKRDAEMAAQQVIVKKTHKGEEVIETKTSIETIDPTKEEELLKSGEAVSSTASTGVASNPETPSKDKANNALSALEFLRDCSSDKRKEEDTTDKHGQHLFDAHCKICNKKTSTPDHSLPHSKSRKSLSPRTSIDNKTPQPKRVRVEFETPTRKMIEEAVKASKSSKTVSTIINAPSIYESSEDFLPSSTVFSSPEAKPNPIPSCWKGFIFMADIAKFVATAHRVSGISDNRLKDVPDTITVRGRIAPEQVLDYLKKLKSTRTDLGVIQFTPANHEERIQYEKFFEYLNRRKRYGVVGAGKSIKDFYILPLPKDADPPEVLLPFDGPGIPLNRPNLLLGILVKNRKHPAKTTLTKDKPISKEPKAAEVVNNVKNEQPDRSYTPPPPGAFPKAEEAANEEPYDPGRSLTPPLNDDNHPPEGTTVKRMDEDEPYDPEENYVPSAVTPIIPSPASTPPIVAAPAAVTSNPSIAPSNLPSLPSSSTSSSPSSSSVPVNPIQAQPPIINQPSMTQLLLEQLSKVSDPAELTQTILTTIEKEPNEEEKNLLREALKKRLVEYEKQMEEQRKAAEAAFTIASKEIEESNSKKVDSIPGLDGSYPTDGESKSISTSSPSSSSMQLL